MATTYIKALHKSGGIAAALARSADYVRNPNKTQDGELVDSYVCQPYTAQSEFLLSKKMYAQKTGRDQGKHDVIAYHLRMSFPPGEVTPEKALELGRELAMRWTRGKHQFIVAAHDDTNNPHVHVIYNSVNLEHNGKWQDFKRSAIALRRVSDQICLEHGLSVIEKPGLSKGHNRAEHLGESKPLTARDHLRELMDSVIPACKDFDSFLVALQAVGVTVKRGKQLSFKLPNAKRFARHDTLGDDYSVEAILEKISGKQAVCSVKDEPPAHALGESKPNQNIIAVVMPVPATRVPKLLIDIEAKLKQANSPGFEHWARIYNLKQMAKTLVYLHDSGIGTYDELNAKIRTLDSEHGGKSNRIKEIESRQKEISELQRQIGTYSKTKDTFNHYRRLKKYKPTTWDKLKNATHPADDYYEACRTDITLCQAAKNYFNAQGYGKNKKLPTIQSLKEEFAILDKEKRKLYNGYGKQRDEVNDLKLARRNVDMFLSEPRLPERNRSHEISL